MHDPSILAFDIHYPWYWKIFRPSKWDCNYYKGNISKKFFVKYHTPFISIWHDDPESDNTDDSCGYSYPKVTETDRVLLGKEAKFSINTNEFFDKDGNPKMDPLSSIIGMSEILAWRIYRKNLTTKQMMMVINLGTSPVDNLRRFFEGKKSIDDIETSYFLVFRCLKRILRPWYKHPKWHVWHWRLQIHPWQKMRRFLFDRCCYRCCYCKKGFKGGESPLSNWSGKSIWHSSCDSKANPRPNPDKIE